ncbi:MAG: hypothetical protein SOY46_07905 [Butyrivibrio crossotus]|nr:hypothetical protein [Butyrivibrio crossotus]
MVYISNRRGFKDFFKSRNTKFYIAIMIIFIAVVITTAIIIHKAKKYNDDKHNTSDTASENINSEPDSESATDIEGIYNIQINLSNYTITIKDYNDNFVRKMLCSFNSFEEGEYKNTGGTGLRNVWYDDKNNFYRYYTDFGNGLIFHSALYSEKNNKNSLNSDEYNMIGGKNNTQGITLSVADAKWIYEHCSFDSVITIYTDKNERHTLELIKIPDGITWDPTDVTTGSPWVQTRIKSMDAPSTITIEEKNSDLSNIKKQIKAFDTDNNDISDYLIISGNFNLNLHGKYQMEIRLIDIYGNDLRKDIELIVTEKETESETETETETETESESHSVKNPETTAKETESETQTKAETESETTPSVSQSESESESES